MTDNYDDNTRQELISTELASKFQPQMSYIEIPNLTIASQAQRHHTNYKNAARKILMNYCSGDNSNQRTYSTPETEE